MGGTAAVIDDTASNDCGEDEAAIVKDWAGGESTDVLVLFVGTCWFCHGCFMLVFDNGIKAATPLAVKRNAKSNVCREMRLAILVQFDREGKEEAKQNCWGFDCAISKIENVG